ncbi:DUF4214 domain-containing protein [Orrella daihaiensis]|nr:DUF4214 domain-containing protein [Orrella daihaiensis]
MIDRTVDKGFDTISFNVSVPINRETGELQTIMPPGHMDKPFPADIWRMYEYVESLGLRAHLELLIRDPITDLMIMKDTVGPNFNSDRMFESVKSYVVPIAEQAQKFGVDGIQLSRYNSGFDTSDYRDQWIDLINGVRNVYTGSIGYANDFRSNNVVWDLVDNVFIGLGLALSTTPLYDAEEIVPLYAQDNVLGQVEQVLERYPEKSVYFGGLAFSPGQPGLGWIENLGSYVWGEDSVAEIPGQSFHRVFPEERINFPMAEAWIEGFFEFFGNYLSDDMAGFQIMQYAPWAELGWIRNPSGNLVAESYSSFARASFLLNYQPESEAVIEDYLDRGWGFKTLHYGTQGNDVLLGSEIDDKFFLSAGDDQLVGADGLDMLVVSASRDQFVLTQFGNKWQLANNGRSEFTGTKTLEGVERIDFMDINVALDTEGVAGQAYRIYKAAFDRAPDLTGLGYWIKAMDAGAALDSVAAGFVSSSEFQTTYGTNISNTDFITLLYANVLDRTPDDSGFDYWLTRMSEGMTREQVLANFSESVENKANVAELIADGIQYTAFMG